MKYNFDELIDRRGTAAYKWNVGKNVLPMWDADMDFQTAPEIRRALDKRTGHGVFGDSVVPQEWYLAYISWWSYRHQYEIDREHLLFCTSATAAIASAVRKMTSPAEYIVLVTPTVSPYLNIVINNGRQVLEAEMQYNTDACRYELDLFDLEKKLANPQTTMLILSNPHNPTGKVWKKEELSSIGELCLKYHVVVISDELLCDLTLPGTSYVPFASVSKVCRNISITCLAPTKSFNLGGLKNAAVMVPDSYIRQKMFRALNTDSLTEPNTYAVTATIAAYMKGAEWLDSLREYIHQNIEYVMEYIDTELTPLHVIKPETGYMLWIDCSELLLMLEAILDSGETEGLSIHLAEDIRVRTGLYLAEGEPNRGFGTHFLGMNLACPKSYVEDGLQRLQTYISNYDL